jgi:hypothetical protein
MPRPVVRIISDFDYVKQAVVRITRPVILCISHIFMSYHVSSCSLSLITPISIQTAIEQ